MENLKHTTQVPLQNWELSLIAVNEPKIGLHY
jgi:hypothetical protein